jgi:hypothetical protein
MITRLTWAAILSIVMIPLMAIGWLDPLEGLPALVLAIGLGVAVRRLSKVRIPKFTWIPFVVTAALMSVTLIVVIVQGSVMMAAQQGSDTVANPMMTEFMLGGVPVAMVLLWASRLADLVLVAGMIYYSVQVWRALVRARHERNGV